VRTLAKRRRLIPLLDMVTAGSLRLRVWKLE
jgi:hypothetical protein